MKIHLIRTVAVLVFLLIAAKPGLASIVRAMDLADLTRAAEQIVVADVLSVESAWDESHRSIRTTIAVGVQESWKGSAPGNGQLLIRQLGGTVGDIEMTVYGMPRFAPGERALLFLEHGRVVGMNQGKRRLQWNSGKRQWQVQAAEASTKMLLHGKKAADAAPPSEAESLDSLRDQVRALMGK